MMRFKLFLESDEFSDHAKEEAKKRGLVHQSHNIWKDQSGQAWNFNPETKKFEIKIGYSLGKPFSTYAEEYQRTGRANKNDLEHIRQKIVQGNQLFNDIEQKLSSKGYEVKINETDPYKALKSKENVKYQRKDRKEDKDWDYSFNGQLNSGYKALMNYKHLLKLADKDKDAEAHEAETYPPERVVTREPR